MQTARDSDQENGVKLGHRCLRALPWLLLMAGLTVVALQRTCEVADEYDRYPDLAVQLTRGVVAIDRFHPFGYPLAIAALLMLLPVSPLVAGCLVSALAAVGLVWASGRLAEGLRAGSASIGWWLAASNSLVWIYGSTACSDMTAAALLAIALALVATPPTTWTVPRLVGLGAALGAAVAVRYAASPLVALVGLWVLWRRPQASTVLAGLAGLTATLLPQALLDLAAGGSPFQNDNWHNLYLTLHCHGNAEQLHAAYANGTMPTLGEFLRSASSDIVAHGLDEARRAFGSILPGMLWGTRNPAPWLAWWPLLVVLASAVAAVRKRHFGLLLAAVLLLFPTFVGFTFTAAPRLFLPVLPIVLAGLAVGVHALGRTCWQRALLLAGIAAATLGTGIASFRDHLESQPVHEVAIAQSLPTRLQRPIRAFATYWLLDHHVAYPCTFLRVTDLGDRDATWRGLRERMTHAGADVLIAGQKNSARIHAQLMAGDPPADFRVVIRDAEVFVAELQLERSDWLQALQVTPPAPRVGESVELRLQLGPTADPAQIASVGAAVRSPAGEQQMFDFPTSANGYRRKFLPTVVGTWILQPIVLRRDGNLLRGAVIELVVKP